MLLGHKKCPSQYRQRLAVGILFKVILFIGMHNDCYLQIEQLYHLCCKVRKGNITSLQSLVKVFMVISHEQGMKATAKEF